MDPAGDLIGWFWRKPSSIILMHHLTNSYTTHYLPEFISKMRAEALPPVLSDTFSTYYKQVVSGETGLISEKEISPVDPEEFEDTRYLSTFTRAGKNALKHAVRIVLNGGLGTSMGLTRAKSLIEVKQGKAFLDIILGQAENSEIRLALMNSFSTDADTRAALSKINPLPPPLIFLQHKFPKILTENLAPATWPKNRDLEWNPPGHGNIYLSLFSSGSLLRLLNDGIKYALITNSDNLGATMDESLLGYFSEKGFPFMMEISERAPADKKGGHIARHTDGRLILREAAQCPEAELRAFQDIQLYRYFNTNNIWVNLGFLKNFLDQHHTILLPLILNPKTLDPRDESSPKVFQIETAMGAAISVFDGATAVIVPKSRLIPVKTTNDLLAVRSDCYLLSDDKGLVLNPDRRLDRLKINLDPRFYGKIDLFNKRFQHGVPSLVDCESITITGDVYFEENITLKGIVKIKNRQNVAAIIREGTVIENDLVCGS